MHLCLASAEHWLDAEGRNKRGRNDTGDAGLLAGYCDPELPYYGYRNKKSVIKCINDAEAGFVPNKQE